MDVSVVLSGFDRIPETHSLYMYGFMGSRRSVGDVVHCKHQCALIVAQVRGRPLMFIIHVVEERTTARRATVATSRCQRVDTVHTANRVVGANVTPAVATYSAVSTAVFVDLTTFTTPVAVRFRTPWSTGTVRPVLAT